MVPDGRAEWAPAATPVEVPGRFLVLLIVCGGGAALGAPVAGCDADQASSRAPARVAKPSARPISSRPEPRPAPKTLRAPRCPALPSRGLPPPRHGDRLLLVRPPPPPPLPPKRAWPDLVRLEATLRGRGAAAARTEARALRARLGPEVLAAVLWSCPPCAKEALENLRQEAERAGWGWTEARHLLPLCGHPREEVRALALWTFGAAATRLGPGRLKQRLEFHLPVFRALALDPSPWVRAEAIALLGALRDRRAHALLVELLGDPSALVRAAAARAIARAVTLVPGAPSTAAVCERLEDPSPWVRGAVLGALAEARHACPLPRVAALLGDRYRVRYRLLAQEGGDQGLLGDGMEVRHAAWRALPPALRPSDPTLPWDLRIREALGSLSRAGIVPAPLPQVATVPTACIPVSSSAPSMGARASASAPGHSESGPFASARGIDALEGLGQPADGMRWRALGRLASIGYDEDPRALLERALGLFEGDSHPLVRATALGILVSLHGSGVPLLEAGLRDRHPAVRLAAVEALGRSFPAESRSRLPALLGDPSSTVRAAALYRLLRDPLAAPPRDAVLRALGESTPVGLRVAIGDRTEEIDPGFGSVRQAALMALEVTWGVRHRGTEAERAARWKDDLRLGTLRNARAP